MGEIRRILVGVDFSACSTTALRQAARLARASGAALSVLHAIDPLVLADLEAVLPRKGESLRADVVSDAELSVERMLEGIERPDPMRISVVVGTPLDEILARARGEQSDLLVLGVRGGSNLGHGASVLASKCVRKAPCDVLLVDEEQQGPFRTVVACVDFTEASRAVVAQAAQIARGDGSELRAVHVFEAPWHRLHYRAPTLQATPQYRREFGHALQKRLESFVLPIARDYGLTPACHIEENRGHGWGVVEYARAHGIDLLVLGTRSRASLRDMLLGSTAERVLRETSRSVFAVRGPSA